MAEERATVDRNSLDQFCCLALVKADLDGDVATASGGVWIGRSSETGCCSGLPQANFCPFCGASIIVTPPNSDLGRQGWSWHTEERRG